MRTFLAFPPSYHNTLTEKLLEERIATALKSRTVCGRLCRDTEAFDQICDCDAVVVLHGEFDHNVMWVIKLAVTLHKTLYVLEEDRLSEIKEVRFALGN